MKFYFVKFEDNYADEFDLDGQFICTSDTLERYKEITEKYFSENDEFYFCFGTNEELEYNSAEELLSCYEIKEITEEQYDVLEEVDICSGINPLEMLEEQLDYYEDPCDDCEKECTEECKYYHPCDHCDKELCDDKCEHYYGYDDEDEPVNLHDFLYGEE